MRVMSSADNDAGPPVGIQVEQLMQWVAAPIGD
jgi:hypothetical protein